MAFTDAQKVKIREYCGFPAFQTASTVLESAMDLVGANASQQAEVETVLAAIAAVEAEITSSLGHVEFEKAEEVTLDRDRDRNMRVRGRREVHRLCFMLGMDGPIRDVFATGWTGSVMGWAG